MAILTVTSPRVTVKASGASPTLCLVPAPHERWPSGDPYPGGGQLPWRRPSRLMSLQARSGLICGNRTRKKIAGGDK